MKDVNRAPAPPFRYGYLLTVDGFISYCKERGVRTDRKQLEYYDEQNLLVPVVGIYHPISVFKKQKQEDGTEVFVEHDGSSKEKRYYHSGGIGIRAPQYTLNYFGLIAQARKPDEKLSQDSENYCEEFHPATSTFIPWQEFRMKSPDFVEHKEELGKPALLCYSPEQIFPLVDIQSRLKITVKDASLFRSDDSWIKSGKEIAKVFSPDLISLKGMVENKYEALRFYYAAEELWFKLINEEMKRLERDPYRADLTKIDFDARVRSWKKKDKSLVAKKILSKHHITVEQLRVMAELFVYPGFSKDPNIDIWEIYREKIPLYWIGKQKGAAKLCQEYYRVAERLLWLLSEVERKESVLEDYYRTRSIRFMESCAICGSGFKPAKKNGRPQVTCGSSNCVDTNRNMNKKKKRLK